jgi:hypothetical protein
MSAYPIVCVNWEKGIARAFVHGSFVVDDTLRSISQGKDFIRNSVKNHAALMLVAKLRPVLGKLGTRFDVAERREFLGQAPVFLEVMPDLRLLDLLHISPEGSAAMIKGRMEPHANQNPKAEGAESLKHYEAKIAGRDCKNCIHSSSPD